MERLYSIQKPYVSTKRFTLKPVLTISLFLALFTVPELKAQNLIIRKSGLLNPSLVKHSSYTIQYANAELVPTTNVKIAA